MDDRYHPAYVLASPTTALWRRAVLLSQHRVDGVWPVTVADTMDGLTYWRGMPAAECRPVENPPGVAASRDDARVLPSAVEVTPEQ